MGPLLFLIYINDLHKSIKHSITHHFINDTNLLLTEKSLKKVNKLINHDLKNLNHWLRANKIAINTNKHLNFRLSDQKINLSKSIKYLGLELDEHLLWDGHTSTLQQKLCSATGMLAKIRHYVDFETLKCIYFAIFNFHLTYGCQMWVQNKVSNNVKRILSQQVKTLKIINFIPKGNVPVEDPFYKAKILKLDDVKFRCQISKLSICIRSITQ